MLINRAESTISIEERAEIRSAIYATAQDSNPRRNHANRPRNQTRAHLVGKHRELLDEVEQLRIKCMGEPKTDSLDMPPHARGVVAEYYVKYMLSRKGIQWCEPKQQSEAFDIGVIGPSGKFYCCEVKGCTKGWSVAIAKTRYVSAERGVVKSRYEPSHNIDFFILVLLEYENIYLVPFKDTIPIGDSICCSPQGWAWRYKDRFDLFI
jgi:hypothetical protein